eukprot:Skav209300  [mRNA]  locus=scaffold994:123247:128211:+ [translate_table: standard]
MAAEHQQTRISAVGLATELSELRDALSKAQGGPRLYHLSPAHATPGEIAQAALSSCVAENKQELDKQVALTKNLAETTAEYKTGKEELWYVRFGKGDVQNDACTLPDQDVESLRLRTQHMEVQRFGQAGRGGGLSL